MRFDDDPLRYLSLCSLYEITADARLGPVPGSLALRLVLAVAFERSNGDRAPFVSFWHACREPHWRAINKSTGNHERGLATERAWNGIAEAMGYSATPELRRRVRETVDPRKRVQRKLARDAHDDREAARTNSTPTR